MGGKYLRMGEKRLPSASRYVSERTVDANFLFVNAS